MVYRDSERQELQRDVILIATSAYTTCSFLVQQIGQRCIFVHFYPSAHSLSSLLVYVIATSEPSMLCQPSSVLSNPPLLSSALLSRHQFTFTPL